VRARKQQTGPPRATRRPTPPPHEKGPGHARDDRICCPDARAAGDRVGDKEPLRCRPLRTSAWPRTLSSAQAEPDDSSREPERLAKMPGEQARRLPVGDTEVSSALPPDRLWAQTRSEPRPQRNDRAAGHDGAAGGVTRMTAQCPRRTISAEYSKCNSVHTSGLRISRGRRCSWEPFWTTA
jgi:hypothetical protein